ncbi:MAG: 3-deoxy-D-manno-octulosonic-acid transferase, partial [Flavobacteriales bacterium]
MQFFYQAGIWCYGLFIKIASIQNAKANLWVTGRKNWRENLKQNLPPSKQNKRIWIHCASLGEFEQGRPVIEAIKEQYPEIFIVLTFYSPSGYELRKDYNKADLICYLPLDT